MDKTPKKPLMKVSCLVVIYKKTNALISLTAHS